MEPPHAANSTCVDIFASWSEKKSGTLRWGWKRIATTDPGAVGVESSLPPLSLQPFLPLARLPPELITMFLHCPGRARAAVQDEKALINCVVSVFSPEAQIN